PSPTALRPAVGAALRAEHLVGVELESALGGDGVGGEVRQAGAGAEDDDAVLLHMPHGTTGDVGLGDLRHRNRRLDPRVASQLLEEVLQRQAVHHGAEHAHVIGTGAVHAELGQFGAAEEVAAADDYAHYHTHARRP